MIKKDPKAVLGLSGVLNRQKRPNLSDLGDIDLAAGVSYPNSEPAKELPPARQQVPSAIGAEYIANTGKMRLPNGTMVNFERRVISDLDKVVIYTGNPRYGETPDITSLAKKVSATGGNITPVVCRDLPNGNLEVIAGSRRTAAVRQEKLPLLADVIVEPITDEIATSISWLENQDRDDPDVFQMARFYRENYDLAQRKQLVTSVTQFAKLYHMTDTNMARYLKVAEIPSWMIGLCPRYDTDVQGAVRPLWTLRKADVLADIYKHAADQFSEEIRSNLEHMKLDTPDDVISRVTKALGQPKVAPSKKLLVFGTTEIGSIEVGRRKKTLKLFISENAPAAMRDEISAIIAKYSSTEN